MNTTQADATMPALGAIQYSDGMYIIANQALAILRRNIRKGLNLPAVDLEQPFEQMEIVLIFAVCHKTYNGRGTQLVARLRRCLGDIDYMRTHPEEGLPDYVIRALQVGIDESILTGDLSEMYSVVMQAAEAGIADEPDIPHRFRLPV